MSGNHLHYQFHVDLLACPYHLSVRLIFEDLRLLLRPFDPFFHLILIVSFHPLKLLILSIILICIVSSANQVREGWVVRLSIVRVLNLPDAIIFIIVGVGGVFDSNSSTNGCWLSLIHYWRWSLLRNFSLRGHSVFAGLIVILFTDCADFLVNAFMPKEFREQGATWVFRTYRISTLHYSVSKTISVWHVRSSSSSSLEQSFTMTISIG